VPGDGDSPPQAGIALCLSGGGYRAMLFHLGALWRLNELAYLPKLARISSVSGGSITAGVLGLKWNRLAFDGLGVAARLREEVIDPIRAMADHTLDVRDVLIGLLTPGTVADRVARSYQDHLFGDATLQDFPDNPRFVINATSVQSGVLWRFSKPFMADWQVGLVKNPNAVSNGSRGVIRVPTRPVPGAIGPDAVHVRAGLRRRPAGRTYTSEAILTAGAGSTIPRFGNRVEELPDGAGQRRGRAPGCGSGSSHGLGTSRVADQRPDRQPGARPSSATVDRIVHQPTTLRHVLGSAQQHEELCGTRCAAMSVRSYTAPRSGTDAARCD
jgi:hypothetical protein